MSKVGADGAPGIYWDGDTRGWAVNFRDARGSYRREYLTGQPADPAERKWPLATIAKHAAIMLPASGTFVLPVSRGKKLDGSIMIVNRKVVSTSKAGA